MMHRLLDDLQVPSPLLSDKIDGISIHIKRDDLIHPIISGNKWRKLKYNLSEFEGKGIISFGGSFSNHLHALAYCCFCLDIPLICFVRGEASNADNPTLVDIAKWNAEIRYCDAPTYRKRYDPNFLFELEKEFPGFQIIPEGGSNELAQKGVAELAEEIIQQFPSIKYLILPVASGGTIAGLINALPEEIQILGVSIQKEKYMEDMIEKLLLRNKSNWTIIRDYHFGGIGRCPQNVREFIRKISEENNILLDPMYNGKALLGALEMVKRQTIISNPQETLYIHTGGTQGLKGYQYLYPDLFSWY